MENKDIVIDEEPTNIRAFGEYTLSNSISSLI
jgi:hypothetical protein